MGSICVEFPLLFCPLIIFVYFSNGFIDCVVKHLHKSQVFESKISFLYQRPFILVNLMESENAQIQKCN